MNDIDLYFEFSVHKGLKKRGLDHLPEYQERLQHEIQTIQTMGFSAYFLIVADILQWAISNGIPIGPGRGSAAGSLVAYALYITHLDPIRYNLIFERFLNPGRLGDPIISTDQLVFKDFKDKILPAIDKEFTIE